MCRQSFGIKIKSALGTGILAMLSCVAQAQVVHRAWNTNNSVNHQEYWIYNNFNWFSMFGKNFSTWTDPNVEQTVKYITYTLQHVDAANGGCYELFTEPVTGNSITTDTRFYANDISFGGNPPYWQSISDDYIPGSDLTSRVRVWISKFNPAWPGGVVFRVQGFSANYNTIDFRLNLHRRKETSSAACRVVGKPFIEVTDFIRFFDTN